MAAPWIMAGGNAGLSDMRFVAHGTRGSQVKSEKVSVNSSRAERGMARKKKGESEALEVDAEDVGTEPDGEAVEVVEDETGGEGGEDAEAGFPLEFRCVAASGETDAEGWVDYYHFETAPKDTMGPDRMMLTIRGRDSATEP